MYSSELLTDVLTCREEVIEEKISLLAEAMYYITLFEIRFTDNKYVDDAKSFIYFYYAAIIKDINKEHDIYDDILEYLDKFEFVTDLTDQDIILGLDCIMDDLEQAMMLRIEKYCPFREHLDDVLKSGILTNSNYLFFNYYDAISDKDVENMKKLIPKGV